MKFLEVKAEINSKPSEFDECMVNVEHIVLAETSHDRPTTTVLTLSNGDGLIINTPYKEFARRLATL